MPVTLLASLVTWPSPVISGDPATTGGSVHQLVEARLRGPTCVGLRIDLARLAFKPGIDPGEIDIRDDAHDADLRSIMTWSVSPDGKRLTIRFASQSSEFGAGNAIRVCVDRAAFRKGNQPSSDRECWTIGTDLL